MPGCSHPHSHPDCSWELAFLRMSPAASLRRCSASNMWKVILVASWIAIIKERKKALTTLLNILSSSVAYIHTTIFQSLRFSAIAAQPSGCSEGNLSSYLAVTLQDCYSWPGQPLLPQKPFTFAEVHKYIPTSEIFTYLAAKRSKERRYLLVSKFLYQQEAMSTKRELYTKHAGFKPERVVKCFLH